MFRSELPEHMCQKRRLVMTSFLPSGILTMQWPLRIVPSDRLFLMNTGISETVEKTNHIAVSYTVVPENWCLEELLCLNKCFAMLL